MTKKILNLKGHPELVSGSKDNGFRNKFGMTVTDESGRSMVEMLGVLAVMGVLSVGGVAMYTNAMNKYRANELLNESSKRAVVIATQILSGKSISADMMNQFDNNGTTFTGVEAVGTNQFKLTLSGVDDDVCTQLKATVGSNTIIQEVGDKCAYLTFNNDLSRGTTSSGDGTGGSEQQEQKNCTEDASICGECQTCVNGTCVAVDNSQRKNCSTGEDGLCVDGKCVDCALGISTTDTDWVVSCSIESCMTVRATDHYHIHSCISNQEKADKWCYKNATYNEGIKRCTGNQCWCDN